MCAYWHLLGAEINGVRTGISTYWEGTSRYRVSQKVGIPAVWLRGKTPLQSRTEVGGGWGRVCGRAVNSKDLKRTLSPALSHGMGEGAVSWWSSVVGLVFCRTLKRPDALLDIRPWFQPFSVCYARSNRSAFITLVQAATKSLTNFSFASLWA